MSAEFKKNNCFDEFNDISPKKKQPTLQALLDYRESYMKLLEKHQSGVQFLQQLIDRNQAQLKEFYSTTIFEISEKMSHDSAIDNEMKTLWLKRFENTMSRSFELSQRLINDFAIKKLDEFCEEAEAMLHDI